MRRLRSAPRTIIELEHRAYLQDAFQDLFRVWEGSSVEDAADVISDACRTIAYQLYGYTGDELNAFERKCRGR